MAYSTVDDIITQAYVLLQDEDRERYTPASVYQALNEGLLETKRLRPDFYRGVAVPQYDVTDAADDVGYPEEYRPALVNYVAGRVQLRDDEENSDVRATVFLNTFTAKLTQVG